MPRPLPTGDAQLIPVLIRFTRDDLAMIDHMRGPKIKRADWVRAAARAFARPAIQELETWIQAGDLIP